MKLYERFGLGGYHTSIATTFSIDFDAYETIVLPRLKGSGCNNNLLITDEQMLGQALSGASTLPKHAGILYTVTSLHAKGVFHPKLFVQLGRKKGRIFVSSANMTTPGLAGNLELGSEISCDGEDSGERQLVVNALSYVRDQLDENQISIRQQLQWMDIRTPWLAKAHPSSEAVTLQDGTRAALLTTGLESGIAPQFLSHIGSDPIEQLIVISPYWDQELQALESIAQSLKTKSTVILLSAEQVQFPGDKLDKITGARVIDLGSFKNGRFVHAKMIIARSQDFDHVLFGSPNCTIAALGDHGFPGINEEVALYRRLPVGLLTEQLDLDNVIHRGVLISPDKLKQEIEDESGEGTLKYPGQFECQFDTLIWTPPKHIDPNKMIIELLDKDATAIQCKLVPSKKETGESFHFEIQGTDHRPGFARLIFEDKTKSTSAIVTLVDQLRHEVRESRSKRINDIAAQLASETVEGLWVLEALNQLESGLLKEKEHQNNLAVARPRIQRSISQEPETHRTLSYENFIAGRRASKGQKKYTNSTLSGTDLSLVRQFLNRVLGLKSVDEHSTIEDEDSISMGLGITDETSNIDDLDSPNQPSVDQRRSPASIEEQNQEARRKKYIQIKSSKDQMSKAVAQFIERIIGKKENGVLEGVDFLRLRTLLTIIVITGSSESAIINSEENLSSLQVLPIEGDVDSWPQLIGQVLYSIFGSNKPAIQFLHIDEFHDQMPDDLMETWAVCLWCLQAALEATVSAKERARLDKSLKSLAIKIYQFLGLAQEEFVSEDMKIIFDQLNDRFAERLGVNGGSIWRNFLATTERQSLSIG